MVRVFYGREATVYPLADLQQMTATEVVMTCTMRDIDENTHLTRLGRVISPSDALSTINIGEEDCLRIVHSEKNEQKNAPTKAELGTRGVMYKCRQLNSDLLVYFGEEHAQLMERISAPDFLATKLDEFPELKMYPAAMDFMSDPELILATIADTEQNIRFNDANPVLIEVVADMLEKSHTSQTYSIDFDLSKTPVPSEPEPERQGFWGFIWKHAGTLLLVLFLYIILQGILNVVKHYCF